MSDINSRTARISGGNFVHVETLAESSGMTKPEAANALLELGIAALSSTEDGAERVAALRSIIRLKIRMCSGEQKPAKKAQK